MGDTSSRNKQSSRKRLVAYLDSVIEHYRLFLPSGLRIRLRAIIAAYVLKFDMYERLPGKALKWAVLRSLCSDAVAYEPTQQFALSYILPYVHPEDVFVDLGCGEGEVLRFVASRRRLKKAVGIEIIPDVARIARRKLANFKLLTPIEVIEGDAAKADLSDGTVYYLFNPFGEKTLRQVLTNIRISLSTNPRRIYILYYNPECAAILDEAPWLRSDGQGEKGLLEEMKGKLRLRVWHN